MIDKFESIVCTMLQPVEADLGITTFDPVEHFKADQNVDADVARSMNAAFLILLAGTRHPAFDRAQALLGGLLN